MFSSTSLVQSLYAALISPSNAVSVIILIIITKCFTESSHSFASLKSKLWFFTKVTSGCNQERERHQSSFSLGDLLTKGRKKFCRKSWDHVCERWRFWDGCFIAQFITVSESDQATHIALAQNVYVLILYLTSVWNFSWRLRGLPSYLFFLLS